MTNPYLYQEREDFIQSLKRFKKFITTYIENPLFSGDFDTVHTALHDNAHDQCINTLIKIRDNPELYDDYLQNQTDSTGTLITPFTDMPEELDFILKEYHFLSQSIQHPNKTFLSMVDINVPPKRYWDLLYGHIKDVYVMRNIAINPHVEWAYDKISLAIDETINITGDDDLWYSLRRMQTDMLVQNITFDIGYCERQPNEFRQSVLDIVTAPGKTTPVLLPYQPLRGSPNP